MTAAINAQLLEALKMLYSETADYIRLNNLGGMDNQCMRMARAAIAAAEPAPIATGDAAGAYLRRSES